MIYCDTSLVATALLPEPDAVPAQAWLQRNGGELAISPWVHTELTGAIARKRRMNLLSLDDGERVLTTWATLRASLTSVPIEHARFEEAARLTLRARVGLRASDALHLAIAAHAAQKVATLDRVMFHAASDLGIPVLDPLAD